MTQARAPIVAGVVVALFAAATAGHAADLTPQEEKLVPLAKEEGAVTLIHPIFSDRTTQLMAKAFVERYGLGPDFDVNFLRKGTGATVAQVRQEIKAGRFTVDAIMVHSPAFFAAGSERDAFLELDSGQWAASETLAKEAGQYINYPYVVVPLAYTFQPVWNTSCPGMKDIKISSSPDNRVTYHSMADPALKGMTIASDITKSFTYTNTVIALDEAGVIDPEEYWPKLKATDPVVEFRTEPKMQMVISCQAPVDMWNIAGRVYQNVLKQPNLKDKIKIGYFEEGQVLLGNQIAVINGAAHPNAARLLIEFLLSKEGTDIYALNDTLYSFREGYTPPEEAQPYLLDLKEIKLIGMNNWVGAQKKFPEVRGAWQKIFQ